MAKLHPLSSHIYEVDLSVYPTTTRGRIISCSNLLFMWSLSACSFLLTCLCHSSVCLEFALTSWSVCLQFAVTSWFVCQSARCSLPAIWLRRLLFWLETMITPCQWVKVISKGFTPAPFKFGHLFTNFRIILFGARRQNCFSVFRIYFLTNFAHSAETNFWTFFG